MLVVVTELNITVITVVSARVAARLLQAGREGWATAQHDPHRVKLQRWQNRTDNTSIVELDNTPGLTPSHHQVSSRWRADIMMITLHGEHFIFFNLKFSISLTLPASPTVLQWGLPAATPRIQELLSNSYVSLLSQSVLFKHHCITAFSSQILGQTAPDTTADTQHLQRDLQ